MVDPVSAIFAILIIDTKLAYRLRGHLVLDRATDIVVLSCGGVLV